MKMTKAIIFFNTVKYLPYVCFRNLKQLC